MKVTTLLGWVTVSVLTLFVFINWSPAVSINFLWVARATMPLSLALGLAAGLGFLAASLFRMMKKDGKKS